MRTDPESGDDLALTEANGAVMIPNPDDTDPIAPFFKLQRWVIRRGFPQLEFFARQFLYMRWQPVETFPEPAVRS